MIIIIKCSTCTTVMMYVFGTLFAIQLLSGFSEATGSSIVGGKVAKAHSKPYMASLHVNGGHTCGGILIREDFVLTAAHCKNESIEKMTVILGAHNISKHEKSQQRIHVAEFYLHPRYTPGGYTNDIMLLKLERKATLNRNVQFIVLPKKNGKIPAQTKCVVAGWGQTEKVPTSDVLKETTEKIQFNFECKNIWQEIFHSDHMICTRPDKKGGVCWGDSGGPLICNTTVQGLVAFVYQDDCSNRTIPHVFTKVHPFLPWIKEVMQRKVVV
nr:granzyme B(G,H)-like [Nerophis lumbriciformis]